MIAGKEGRHAWTAPGDGEPAVTLGLLRDDEGKEVWPRYKIRNIGGLKGLGDPEDARSPRVGGVGEIAERSERRGKSVSYSGVIEAKSLRQLEEAAADLRAAFADLTSEGRMDVTWHPSNTEYEDVPAKFYEARALTCEVIEELQGKRYVWPFVIGLRAGDPRYFEEEAETHEVSVEATKEAVSLGALSVPVNSRGPIVGLTLPAHEQSVDIVIRNVTTGKALRLNLPEEWDGSDLSLDFYARRITDGDGADRSRLLDPEDCDLWLERQPLAVGEENTIAVEVQPPIFSQTKAPGSVVSDSSVGTVAWATPGAATASDDSRATATFAEKSLPQTSHYLKATDFGFTVPEGFEPLAVAPSVERSSSGVGVISDAHLKLVKGGVVSGDDRAESGFWSTADALISYGEGDLFGNELDQSDVVAEDFGFALAVDTLISAPASSARVDHMLLTVSYAHEAEPYAATVTLQWQKGYF